MDGSGIVLNFDQNIFTLFFTLSVRQDALISVIFFECSAVSQKSLLYIISPRSPLYDTSEEWLFVCLGDATQTLEQSSRSIQPLGLQGRPGAPQGSGPTLSQTSGFNP